MTSSTEAVRDWVSIASGGALGGHWTRRWTSCERRWRPPPRIWGCISGGLREIRRGGAATCGWSAMWVSTFSGGMFDEPGRYTDRLPPKDIRIIAKILRAMGRTSSICWPADSLQSRPEIKPPPSRPPHSATTKPALHAAGRRTRRPKAGGPGHRRRAAAHRSGKPIEVVAAPVPAGDHHRADRADLPPRRGRLLRSDTPGVRGVAASLQAFDHLDVPQPCVPNRLIWSPGGRPDAAALVAVDARRRCISGIYWTQRAPVGRRDETCKAQPGIMIVTTQQPPDW